jgi:hypothetical protein
MKHRITTVALWALSLMVVGSASAYATGKLIASKDVKNRSLLGIDLKKKTLGAVNYGTGSVGYNALDAETRTAITSGLEVQATGSINLDATAQVTLATNRSYNTLGANFSTNSAERAGQGTYVVTVPGLNTQGPHLNVFTSLSVPADNPYWATARISGTKIVIQTFSTNGLASDLPANSLIAFLLT